jgi:hypothetical protein
MTDTPLQAVALFDAETQAYKPAAHNLSADEAANLMQNFTADGKQAKVMGQEERHRRSDPWKCKPCKQAAEKLAEPPATAVQPSDTPASQE